MHNYECENHGTDTRVNGFIDLNGIHYVLAEYLDRNNFQQIDRSLIKSEIIVDQSESMRAIIDINIDDIGRRASDGHLAIMGNNTKQNNLLKSIQTNCEIIDHQLSTLRRGIVVRVDYQLENYRTHKVIRSMTEEFRINDRNYFLDINPRNVNDNAIIVNFCNTIVSTINEFTHGQDPMIIRITNVHMSYEMVKPGPHMPRIKQSMTSCYQNECSPGIYGRENDVYNYHKTMQNRHVMPGYDPNEYYTNEPVRKIIPDGWSMFNRFYHFGNGGKDIIIHDQEVYDPMTKVALIPCGTVHVNRTFVINPGHRLIFKFCIWKNDVVVVNDTTPIAYALRVPFVDDPYGCTHTPIHQHHPVYPMELPNHCDHQCQDLDYETVIRMLHENKHIEHRQNQTINQLTNRVSELTELVRSLVPEPELPEEPIPPTDDSITCCDECDTEHDRLEEKINEVDNDVVNIQNAIEAIPEIKPISIDDINDIIDEANDQV